MPTKIERERAKFMYEGRVSGSHSGAEKGKMVVVSIFGGRLVIGFRRQLLSVWTARVHVNAKTRALRY